VNDPLRVGLAEAHPEIRREAESVHRRIVGGGREPLPEREGAEHASDVLQELLEPLP
jgi:hypothetical protein